MESAVDNDGQGTPGPGCDVAKKNTNHPAISPTKY